jgi:hypothetical protein
MLAIDKGDWAAGVKSKKLVRFDASSRSLMSLLLLLQIHGVLGEKNCTAASVTGMVQVKNNTWCATTNEALEEVATCTIIDQFCVHDCPTCTQATLETLQLRKITSHSGHGRVSLCLKNVGFTSLKPFARLSGSLTGGLHIIGISVTSLDGLQNIDGFCLDTWSTSIYLYTDTLEDATALTGAIYDRSKIVVTSCAKLACVPFDWPENDKNGKRIRQHGYPCPNPSGPQTPAPFRVFGEHNYDAQLLMWFDATDISSLTLDSSGGVSEWRDKSGHARHLAQTEAARRPTYNAHSVAFSSDVKKHIKTATEDEFTSGPFHVFAKLNMGPASEHTKYVWDALPMDHMALSSGHSSEGSLMMYQGYQLHCVYNGYGKETVVEFVYNGHSSKMDAGEGGGWCTGTDGSNTAGIKGMIFGDDGGIRESLSKPTFSITEFLLYKGTLSEAERAMLQRHVSGDIVRTSSFWRLTSIRNTNEGFWCMGEIEFLDLSGARISTTGSRFSASSCADGDDCSASSGAYRAACAFNGGGTADDYCSDWTTDSGWIQIDFRYSATYVHERM